MSQPSHSAAASALGYLFQSQWPLLELVRGSADRPDGTVSVELHDDVAWEQDGTPIELLQLKHHPRSVRSLGDRDADLWRTIRAWMDTHQPGDPNGPTLTMVTTQTAAEGSAAAALRPHTHNPQAAMRLLDAAARESTAQASRETRERFLALSDAERGIFVQRMFVLDQSPTIEDLDAELRRELRLVLPRGHEDTFMSLLWAWWHALVVKLLQGQGNTVGAVDVMIFIDDLRDQFTRDNLPTLVGPEDLEALRASDYAERVFVHQLRWVDVPGKILQTAIIDYYRAYTQTARWVEDDLIGLDELDRFENELGDEWDREFAWMTADLPADADEQTKQRAGQRLLRAALDQTSVTVRKRYNEPFFSRGKHHELADDGRLGWHPDFERRLQVLLLSRSA